MSTARKQRATRLLFVGCLALLVNSAYLAVFASPTIFYFTNVLFHVGCGIVLVIPFLLYGLRLARTAAAHTDHRWGALAAPFFW